VTFKWGHYKKSGGTKKNFSGSLVLTICQYHLQMLWFFSTLNRVKTYLRSSMGEKRVNNLCVLNIEREPSAARLDVVNPVIDELALMKNRRSTASALIKRTTST
jgi:hypothetical protein